MAKIWKYAAETAQQSNTPFHLRHSKFEGQYSETTYLYKLAIKVKVTYWLSNSLLQKRVDHYYRSWNSTTWQPFVDIHCPNKALGPTLDVATTKAT